MCTVLGNEIRSKVQSLEHGMHSYPGVKLHISGKKHQLLSSVLFLAELFRGMLFKWKGANKKSHQK